MIKITTTGLDIEADTIEELQAAVTIYKSELHEICMSYAQLEHGTATKRSAASAPPSLADGSEEERLESIYCAKYSISSFRYTSALKAKYPSRLEALRGQLGEEASVVSSEAESGAPMSEDDSVM